MSDKPRAGQKPPNARGPRVLHPFLLGLFFVLAFYSGNMRQFEITRVVLPAVAVLVMVLLVWLVIRHLLRSGIKAGHVVSLAVSLFLSYGYAYDVISRNGGLSVCILKLQVDTRGTLFVLWTLGIIVGTWRIVRTRRPLIAATKVLNVLAACFVVSSAAHIAIFTLRAVAPSAESMPPRLAPPPRRQLPHICYIVPDGYGRSDVLADVYGYDNSAFLEFLAQKGFYVAKKARANYCRTSLSQPSTLNMRYLDDVFEAVGTDTDDLRPVQRMIKDNEVCRLLSKCGYRLVTFATGYGATDSLKDARRLGPGQWLGEFETGFLNSTMAGPVLLKAGGILGDPYDAHRRRVLYALERLPGVFRSDEPVFVYAHLLVPHPPFVFEADGTPAHPAYPYKMADGSYLCRPEHDVTRQTYKQRYVDQLTFLNGKLRETIEGILAGSSRPVVILLQADHGPGAMLDCDSMEKTNLRERMAILSAYHFPRRRYARLYEGVSAVNSFRVILNEHLGGTLPLLEDKSYFSVWPKPYQVREVPAANVKDTGRRAARQ